MGRRWFGEEGEFACAHCLWQCQWGNGIQQMWSLPEGKRVACGRRRRGNGA